MLPIDARLYLPISPQQLSPVLVDEADIAKSISTLEAPQLASLMVLHALPLLSVQQAGRTEHLLSQTLEVCNARIAELGLGEFRRGMSEELDQERLIEGRRRIDDFGIALLDDDDVRWRSYLTDTYEWDRNFCDRHRQRLRERLERVAMPSGMDQLLTEQQSGVYRRVRAQSDDHLHVQGYAGTGKSLLVHSLLDLLRGDERRVLVLAERTPQLRALMVGVEGFNEVEGMTFGQLAARMTPTDLIQRGQRGVYYENSTRNPVQEDEIVRHLGIHTLGDFSALQLAKLAHATVVKFCFTSDQEIDEAHLPEGADDPAARQVIMHHATQLWNVTIAPGSGAFRPPLREYHRIKLAALRQWRIPEKYTHVLIDECHDLSKPVLQILDVSPQAVISFGDEYQHLRGRAHARDSAIKRLVITHSVRSAKAIEAIANPIIRAHPGETKDAFLGHQRYRAEVIYYTTPDIPDRPAAILTQDMWELFEWAQRLADRGLTFRPLSDFKWLGRWVDDCIDLYARGTRPRDPSLFRFHTWDEVRNVLGWHPGFRRMDEALRKGYGREHWQRTAGYVDQQASAGYGLGMVKDVRNHEFADVMLAPGVVSDLWSREPGILTSATALVYVAVTRAQHRLFVPATLRDWLEERKRG